MMTQMTDKIQSIVLQEYVRLLYSSILYLFMVDITFKYSLKLVKKVNNNIGLLKKVHKKWKGIIIIINKKIYPINGENIIVTSHKNIKLMMK